MCASALVYQPCSSSYHAQWGVCIVVPHLLLRGARYRIVTPKGSNGFDSIILPYLCFQTPYTACATFSAGFATRVTCQSVSSGTFPGSDVQISYLPRAATFLENSGYAGFAQVFLFHPQTCASYAGCLDRSLYTYMLKSSPMRFFSKLTVVSEMASF